MSLLGELSEMLTYARPAGSDTESTFIARYVATLPNATQDTCGNWHVVTDSASRTLWSSHTDTVHHSEGRQTLHYDPKDATLQLSRRSRKRMSCLGADDTVGVFLMRRMILANVPGHYMFHYGEERGGIGSSAYADTYPDLLARFDRAIALDRGGYRDVITSQYGNETASDTFALALADLLQMNYAPTHGVYTDTAEYAHLIPECTNLSVGYFFAHTERECVDTSHVFALLVRLVAVDVSTLPTVRDPKASDLYVGSSSRFYGSLSLVPRIVDLPEDYELSAMSLEDIESALDMAYWKEDYDLADVLETEKERREDAITSNYLDPEYADIQRLLYRQNGGQ